MGPIQWMLSKLIIREDIWNAYIATNRLFEHQITTTLQAPSVWYSHPDNSTRCYELFGSNTTPKPEHEWTIDEMIDPNFEPEPVPELLPAWRYVGWWLDERLEIDMNEYFNLVEEPTNETREPDGLGFESLENRENLSVFPEPEPETAPEPGPESVPEPEPEVVPEIKPLERRPFNPPPGSSFLRPELRLIAKSQAEAITGDRVLNGGQTLGFKKVDTKKPVVKKQRRIKSGGGAVKRA
jgi:hypothetical protein